MQISKTSGSLVRDNSLIIVTGTHLAKVYRIKDGKVSKQPTLSIMDPILTDKEGTRRREGRGTIWGTASDYEQHDNNVKVAFLNALKKELKNVLSEEDVTSINIFSPTSTIKDVKAALPKAAQKKIDVEYTGNFTKSSPTDLANKLRKKTTNQMREAVDHLRPSASKILKRKKTRNNTK